eukprot:CAMPEP_0181125536 /NCGR_PEP_ID=MMETSP1071-20121207/27106_1 /TAXON_ID=35127 /ORGANISM="Thalassiosira sp., Strain NH16" /LENGTH=56 /DNA_ID=CAMNT_0023210993 /DNA_START=119 /DNA_END=286 /DNA_ORIENTATION=-
MRGVPISLRKTVYASGTLPRSAGNVAATMGAQISRYMEACCDLIGDLVSVSMGVAD